MRITKSGDGRNRFTVRIEHRLGGLELARLLASADVHQPDMEDLQAAANSYDYTRLPKSLITKIINDEIYYRGTDAYASEDDPISDHHTPHEAQAIARWAAFQVRVNYPDLVDDALTGWVRDYDKEADGDA